MNSKNLTKQQQRRIKQNKAIDSASSSQQGTIVCHYGKEVDIESDINKIIRCNLRQNLEALAVGDLVTYQDNIITGLLPRKSLLERTSLKHLRANSKPKPIAANIDQLFIIIAPKPEPQMYLIDQFLAIAEICHIEPIIILNKTDLLKSNNTHDAKDTKDIKDKKNIEHIENFLNIYQQIGYQLIKLSALNNKNYHDLEHLLENKTSIFVGQSGVGKSTITQRLVPDKDIAKDIATGAISEKSELGRHTTTTARLYHLANSGNLIDAPGIREMGVAHLDRQTLEYGYKEFRPYIGQCKFKDCIHEREPDCAFKHAVTNGDISELRWQNYKKLVASLNA